MIWKCRWPTSRRSWPRRTRPARNSLIAAHLDRLEAELAQTRAAVESLRDLLQPPGGVTAIEHRSVPATAVAAIMAVVDRADALAWWQGALGELRATVRAQHLRAAGPGRRGVRQRAVPA